MMTCGLKLFSLKLKQLQKNLKSCLSLPSLEESHNALNVMEMLFSDAESSALE